MTINNKSERNYRGKCLGWPVTSYGGECRRQAGCNVGSFDSFTDVHLISITFVPRVLDNLQGVI